MAAPDTTTFSLQDIKDDCMQNMGASESNFNLRHCIELGMGTVSWNVDRDYFDSTAYAGATLYDLRNYQDGVDRLDNSNPTVHYESLLGGS